MEKQPLSGSEQKIREYVARIKGGESKDSIMQELPPSFITGIEAVLNESEKGGLNSSQQDNTSALFEYTEQQKKIRKIQEQKQIDVLREQLGIKKESNDINYDLLTPEDVLKQLAEYSEPYMSAPIEAVQDGTFAGWAKLKIENGAVVLARHALDENHLIKDGKTASSSDMLNSSLFSGGAHESGSVHTSADIENWANRYDVYSVYGEFSIPVKDFLQLGKEGKIIIGNLGEAEIVLSGDVAKKYLTKVVNK